MLVSYEAMTQAASSPAPPAAPGLPLVGDALAMAGDVGAFFTQQYLRLGPVFRVHALNRRFTVLAGPEANLFVTREGRLHLRSREFWMDFDRELGAARSMLSMDGAEHARMRKAQKTGYSRSFIHEHLDEVIAITRREVSAWPLDEPVPGLYALQRIITDQLGTIAAGMSPRDYLDDMIVFVRTLLAARVTHQRPALLMRTPRFRRARQRVEELYATVRAAHENEPAHRPDADTDLVDDLLALHHADPQFLPETDLMPAVLGPFIAGLDTVGSTCAFMLYALLKHPDLLERMTAEADASFDGGTLTADALRRLDVTHRVGLETLRMYPIAPAITRTVSNTFEFAGVHHTRGRAGHRRDHRAAPPGAVLPRTGALRYRPLHARAAGTPPARRLRPVRRRPARLPRGRVRGGVHRRDHGHHRPRDRAGARPARLCAEDQSGPHPQPRRPLQVSCGPPAPPGGIDLTQNV